MALKRIEFDLRRIKERNELFFLVDIISEIDYHPLDGSPLQRFLIDPPKYGPYADLPITVIIIYSPDHPFRPPSILLDPPVLHPNVHKFSGEVALKKEQWSPVFHTKDLLVMIWNMLLMPVERSRKSQERKIYLESFKGSDVSSIDEMHNLIAKVNHVSPREILKYLRSISDKNQELANMLLYNEYEVADNLIIYFNEIYKELANKITKIDVKDDNQSWQETYWEGLRNLAIRFDF